jgi:asparagine synthase (glutamine-hydrolysing)
MLCRDRLGIQPVFYALTEYGLWFASELKAILMGGSVNREIDHHALMDLFTIGFVSAPHTLFRNIRRLLPGHYLLYQDGGLSIHQYWDVCFPELECGTNQPREGEWADALKAKLLESVRIHLRSGVDVGASLSSGIDSSGIVGLMNKLVDTPIQTFSLGYENARYDELNGVKTLKDFCGFRLLNQQVMCKTDDFELFPKAVWHCEDPFTTGLEIPRMLLSRLASQHVKVVLTGDGSDEIFGAYPWFKVDQTLRQVMRLPLQLRRIIAQIPSFKRRWSRASRRLSASAEMNRACYKHIIDSVHEDFDVSLFAGDLRSALPSEEERDAHVSLPAGYERWHPFHQLQYWELKVRLPDYTARRLDAASMAYSLQTRTPFLDHELVELCSQIPLKLTMRGGTDKHIFRLAMRDVLPAEIINRAKRGLLAPYDQWIQNPPEFAIELLSERQLHDKGYFSPKMVSELLRQHRTGEASHGSTLMGVLGVQLWDDVFVHGCRPS